MRCTRLPLGWMLLAVPLSASAADWPQWRGPDRTNVSKESKLLTEWPKDGPPEVWTARGLGQGVPSVAVAGGRVFTLGYRDQQEFATALSEKDGTVVWSTALGPQAKELPSMRWLSQRTPTVDGDRVYTFTVRGELICLAVADGKELWRKDYVKDFGGKAGNWGYCDFPLVDGERLICTPGAKEHGIVALDKKTGKTLWHCEIPGNARGTYGGIVAAELAGGRQYVHQLESSVVSVSTEGKLLWQYPNFGASFGNVHTVLVRDDEVYASCGWNVGAALLRVKKSGDGLQVEEIYRTKGTKFDPWLGSSVRIGNFVHAANGLSIDWKNGEVVESSGTIVPTSRIAMTAADGRLIHRTGNGLVTLTEITGEGGYVRRGEFQFGPANKADPTWTFPVVANGRLFLRDQDLLRCYDLRMKDNETKKPSVIFVPTPQDIVEKMLEAAAVSKVDVVADLGCGDGRIVVTAARKYGCRARGYELDPECIALARDAVKSAGVEKLVSIQEADILDVQLDGYSAVFLYLGESLNEKLVPQFKKLKKGAKVISHAFPIPGLKPDRVIHVTSKEDDVERPLYLYTAPFTLLPATR